METGPAGHEPARPGDGPPGSRASAGPGEEPGGRGHEPTRPGEEPVGAGVLAVGYRGSSMVTSGIVAVVLVLGAAYSGFLALGIGSAFGAVAFVVIGLAVLLLVPLYLRAVVRAVRGAPLLTLDREGVTLHSARVRLLWSNVAEIRIDHTAGRGPASDMIVFVPVDEHAAMASLRGLPRRFARDGIKRLGGPIFVRARDLASPAEEILAAARRSTPAPVRHRHALGRQPRISG